MSIWLPPGVTREMEAQRQEHTAVMLRHLEVKGTFEHWNRELRQIDSRLQLVKARDDANIPGLKAGYWHVLRDNAEAPPLIVVHEGPNGEFREPDSGLLERLKRSDLWSDRSQVERRRKLRKLEEAKQRERAHEAADRREELADRLRFRTVPSIRVPRSIA